METLIKHTARIPSEHKKDVRIFIVDEDKEYCHNLEQELRTKHEYRTFTFQSGEDCLRHALLFNPEIVILSYGLNKASPGEFNSLDILERLKMMKPEVCVLMVSEEDSLDAAAQSLKCGAFDFILKNKNTGSRLHKLIPGIVKQNCMLQVKRGQKKYFQLLILISLAIISAPVFFQYAVPDGMHWMILAILSGYLMLTYIIHKLNALKTIPQ